MRSSSRQLLRAIAAALLVSPAAAMPGAAQAQSLFQQLFGGPPQPAPMPAPPPVLLTPGGAHYPPPRGPLQPVPAQRPARDEASEPAGREAGTRGNYRTVCVRLCDGFYFPMSQAVGRRRFQLDAQACSAQCGDQGRLFYLPQDGEIADATDLAGRPYARLANAFRYRKSLIDGCGCRPAPWAQAELDRHQQYAAAAALSRPRLVPAGEDDDSGTLAAARLAAAREEMPDEAALETLRADYARPADAVADAAAAGARPMEVAPARRPRALAQASTGERARAATPLPIRHQPMPAPPRPAFAAAPQSPPAKGLLMSLGGGGMTWPGDRPRQ